jgi:alkanesulfonate monooxygenase SsuD/methylene tetrahydromethanopterin reductase-like flavin-dependent oxidoreductase (luciferase family)
MNEMKIGLHMPETERVVRWTEIADLCRTAEEVGFDSIWVPDHLIYREPDGTATGPWECWSLLCAIAAITSRVEIAPLVLCTSFREPGMIAKMAATLDEISAGRLILGLGAGWNEPEYTAFGFPFESRFGRFMESFAIIRTLLAEGHIDFEGKYYTLRECEIRPSGPTSGGPPLMIGSRGPKVLQATLPYVDYWNGWARWWGNDPDQFAPLLEQVDSIALEVSRNPSEIGKTCSLFIGLEGRVTEDNPEAPHFSGTEDEIVDLLRRYHLMGVDHVQIVLDPITSAGVTQFGRIIEKYRSA